MRKGTRRNQRVRDEYGLTILQRAAVDAYLYHEDEKVRGSQIEAYLAAGYSARQARDTAKDNASRLFRSSNVIAALEAEQAKMRADNGVSVASLVRELETARLLAIKEGQASAAVQASMAKAKLHGLSIDKAHNITESKVELSEKPDLQAMLDQVRQN